MRHVGVAVVVAGAAPKKNLLVWVEEDDRYKISRILKRFQGKILVYI